MRIPPVYLQCERCHPCITPGFSSFLKILPVPQTRRRPFHRCPLSIDQLAPETSRLISTKLEQRRPRPAQSLRLASGESHSRLLASDASFSARSGAALSVVPAQSGIVHSRIAAWGGGEPLRLLLRASGECLASSISLQILATERPYVPDSIQIRALTTCDHTGMCKGCTKYPHTETCLQVRSVAL